MNQFKIIASTVGIICSICLYVTVVTAMMISALKLLSTVVPGVITICIWIGIVSALLALPFVYKAMTKEKEKKK